MSIDRMKSLRLAVLVGALGLSVALPHAYAQETPKPAAKEAPKPASKDSTEPTAQKKPEAEKRIRLSKQRRPLKRRNRLNRRRMRPMALPCRNIAMTDPAAGAD